MKIKATLREYLTNHSKGGVWSGKVENGTPVVITHEGVVPAEPLLNQLGIKLTKSNKYTEREDYAGMGKVITGGDSPDIGNGISQGEE